MKPKQLNFWRWHSQSVLTSTATAFVVIIDEDKARQVIRQIPDDRD